ncbi:hypothetical protein MC885_021465 [Smutsia gigantea]|nr:hypothetical protein MC885_021465 [Smutsia gigantea]
MVKKLDKKVRRKGLQFPHGSWQHSGSWVERVTCIKHLPSTALPLGGLLGWPGHTLSDQKLFNIGQPLGLVLDFRKLIFQLPAHALTWHQAAPHTLPIVICARSGAVGPGAGRCHPWAGPKEEWQPCLPLCQPPFPPHTDLHGVGALGSSEE